MNKLAKVKFVGLVFAHGAKHQLKQEWVYGMAAVVALSQGLKYTGDFKRGIIGGAAVLGTLAVMNGIYNVVDNWDKIVEL